MHRYQATGTQVGNEIYCIRQNLRLFNAYDLTGKIKWPVKKKKNGHERTVGKESEENCKCKHNRAALIRTHQTQSKNNSTGTAAKLIKTRTRYNANEISNISSKPNHSNNEYTTRSAPISVRGERDLQYESLHLDAAGYPLTSKT
jgi:hypothetical protein